MNLVRATACSLVAISREVRTSLTNLVRAEGVRSDTAHAARIGPSDRPEQKRREPASHDARAGGRRSTFPETPARAIPR